MKTDSMLGKYIILFFLLSSVVAACRLSCSEACGILVPQPGIDPLFPELQGGFLSTRSPGKSQEKTFFLIKIEYNESTQNPETYFYQEELSFSLG